MKLSRHLLAASLALLAMPSAAHAEVGSVGLGDPYFPDAGNGGYDVSSYDLDLDYAPKRNRLRGEAAIEATAETSLERFNLDFRDALEVTRVSVDGAAAAFEHAGQELSITPASPIAPARAFSVEVSYKGVPKPVRDPDGADEGWIQTRDGAFAPNEPQGSPSWYPCNDHPSDKALFSISLTVPKKLQAISNGRLLGREKSGGKRTWSWAQDEPMATYLATVAIGKFKIKRSKQGEVSSLYAVDPVIRRKARNAKRELRPLYDTPRLTRFLAKKLGPYPFASNGGIVDHVPDFPYALETQTRPIYTSPPDDFLVIHEIAHQWFGDSVTPASWSDIWLNEGFASYAEWLYSGKADGPGPGKIFDRFYKIPASDKDFWSPPPGNPGSAKHLFDDTVYTRGAMTLQALRERVGKQDFFEILRRWLSEHAYGNVTTSEFINLAESVSGEELSGLFQVWLYDEGKPQSW